MHVSMYVFNLLENIGMGKEAWSHVPPSQCYVSIFFLNFNNKVF